MQPEAASVLYYMCTGCNEPHSPQVGKSLTFLIFPQISIIFSYFSSNFSHFCPHFGPLDEGRPPGEALATPLIT